MDLEKRVEKLEERTAQADRGDWTASPNLAKILGQHDEMWKEYQARHTTIGFIKRVGKWVAGAVVFLTSVLVFIRQLLDPIFKAGE